MSKIKLGDLARDMITGFKGVVIARTEWLNGCARLSLQPRELDKEKRVIMSETFDETQLELVEEEAIKLPGSRTKKAVTTGGPRPNLEKFPDVKP